MKRSKVLFIICLLSFTFFNSYSAIDLKPTNYVNDFENVFTPAQEASLNKMIKDYQDSTSIEICVVSIEDIPDDFATLQDFSVALGNQWGVGSKELNNGLMIVFSVKNRKWQISPGYGLEPLITDAFCSQAGQRDLVPNFRKQDYYTGVQSLLKSVMDEMGYEGYEQLIEKQRIQKEKAKEELKDAGMTVLYVIISLAFLAGMFFLIRFLYKKRQAYLELERQVTFMHDRVMKLKGELILILGQVPNDIQSDYIAVMNKNTPVISEENLDKLSALEEKMVDFKRLINTTNNTISDIINAGAEIEKYLKTKYEYCEDYLKENLKSIQVNQTDPVFTSIEFTPERLEKLRNINSALSGKISLILGKMSKINSIVSDKKNAETEVKKLEKDYETYKKNKVTMMGLPIGNRLNSLPKLNVEEYISNIKDEIGKSFEELKNNNFKQADYHYGIYLTTLAVLTKNFESSSQILREYENGVKYIDNNKSNIPIWMKKVEDKINDSDVSSSRASTLSKIKADINKFNNNIAVDVILSAILLEGILTGLKDLLSDIESDISHAKNARAAAAAAAAAAISRRNDDNDSYHSSSPSNFGGFGGGSFGGGGAGGSW